MTERARGHMWCASAGYGGRQGTKGAHGWCTGVWVVGVHGWVRVLGQGMGLGLGTGPGTGPSLGTGPGLALAVPTRTQPSPSCTAPYQPGPRLT